MAREDLHEYFRSVVRNLIVRGAIRKQAGMSLDDILRQESAVVMQEVKEDFFAVGAELGLGLVTGLGSMLGSAVQQGVGRMGNTVGAILSEMLSGKKK